MEQEPTNLPAQIAEAIVSIPKGLTPGVIKALDRLVGAAVDLPVAWLKQKTAKIDTKTESFKLVEASIAKSAALSAGGDSEIAQRALNTLVRKEYRKQTNREAVAAAMVEDLRDETSDNTAPSDPAIELDDDWLNVFEQYAENASSEKLQGLWGKVLAGEIRRSGQFSRKTLRFLSEISQADALDFETFAKSSFGDFAPRKSVEPKDNANIAHLITLEASGLIQGVSAIGLSKTFTFSESGQVFLNEGNLAICLTGEPGTEVTYAVIPLTALGQEVLCLIGNRNARDAARVVALAIRTPEIHEAYLGVRDTSVKGRINVVETLWLKDAPESQTIEETAG